MNRVVLDVKDHVFKIFIKKNVVMMNLICILN